MKILHLADLHLGKLLHTQSMIEDQRYWIGQILNFVRENRPDAVVIAGDVYDRGVPAREAVPLLSMLLEGLSAEKTPVMLIAGNHDGGERLEFVRNLLSGADVHIAGIVRREMVHVTLTDAYGPVTFWLMPYLFPAAVRDTLGVDEAAISGYTEAARALLAAQEIDFTQRNVLVAHQTVEFGGKSPEQSGSESSIGGVGGIDAAVFDGFDYVALGHLHGSVRVGREAVRYAGSPLVYHFDEAEQKKGPLLVTLGEKGQPVDIRMQTLQPLHRVRPVMRGRLADIIAREQESTARGEYVSVKLTDDWVRPDTHETLRALFAAHDCRLLDIGREHLRTGEQETQQSAQAREEMNLEEYFLHFYRLRTEQDDPQPKDAAFIHFAAAGISSGTEQSEEEAAAALADFALEQEE